jgi:hypothetical protein
MKPYNIYSKENLLERILRTILLFCHRILRGSANHLLSKKVIHPRDFSNAILKYYAPLFTGSVINVSGWKDGDFENGFYKTYFTNASSYHISNAPTKSKGTGSLEAEIEIDLSKPLDPALHKKFDIVFNHTTLEHIFELDIAFKNLCDLSKDVVILVVPLLQQIHFNKGYGDYNRLTSMGVAKQFDKNNFELLVLQTNEQPFAPLYSFAIAVRKDSKYLNEIERNIDFSMGGALYGSKINPTHLHDHVPYTQERP